MSKVKIIFRARFFLFIPIVVLSCLVALPTPLNALSGGQGLEIAPPSIELNVDPGQTVTFAIRLRNITKDTLVTKASIDDFVAAGEDGRPKLLLDPNAEPSPFSFKPWITSLPGMTLVPQEAKITKVTMEVPKNASPGGHYGVIRFSALPPELEGSGVSLSASLGTLVLVNVSGDVQTKATLADFFVMQNGDKKSLFENGPVTFVERIKNEGNVHFKPTGTLRVTDMFGNEVQVLSINEKAGNVLPASIRRFEQVLNNKQLLGLYNVEANIQYNGKSLQNNLSFWVIPYKLVAIGLGVLLLVVIAFVSGLKRYNRYIIAKAHAGSKPKNKKT